MTPPANTLCLLTSRQIAALIRCRLTDDSDSGWSDAIGTVERDMNGLREAFGSGADWRLIYTALLIEMGEIVRSKGVAA